MIVDGFVFGVTRSLLVFGWGGFCGFAESFTF